MSEVKKDGGPEVLSTIGAAIIGAALVVASAAAMYLFYGFMLKSYGPAGFESACSWNETFDCDRLNTSEHGKITLLASIGALVDIPITLFGLAAYLAMGLLTLRARRGGAAGRAALRLLAAAAGVSVLYGLQLFYVMRFVESVYCPYCLAMDIAAVVILVTSVLALRGSGAKGDVSFGAPATTAVVAGLALFVVLLGAHSTWKSSLVKEQIAQVEAEIGDGDTGPVAAPVGAVDPNYVGPLGKGVVGTGGEIGKNVWDVPVDISDPFVGPVDAKVTVVEFADFQCGYCKKLFYSLNPIKKKYKDEVRFVFKHFPMSPTCNPAVKNNRHRYACEAAVAAQCTGEQDLFWPMHDLLFKNQHKLKAKDLSYYASEVGADMGRWRTCMKSGSKARAAVKQDAEHGGLMKLNGTPRTFINGRLFKGIVAQETLEHYIEKELGRVEAGAKPVRRAVPQVDKAAAASAPTMVEVTNGSSPFWIDTFESSVDSEGRALSLHGAEPANVNWYDAVAACTAAGKRVCSSEEWVTACQSAPAVDDDNNGQFGDDYVEGNQFPYADYYERGWCNDIQKGPSDGGKADATGIRPRCKTPSGIYDLAGNVSEWVGTDEDTARLLGGHFYAKDKAACFRPVSTFGAGHRNKTMGFRCCADTNIANPSSDAVARLAPEGFEGKPLPEFTAHLLDGTVVESASLRGKVTYLSFFASWCGPCKAEFVGLNRMAKHYAGKDFQILAVGVDTKEGKAGSAAKAWGATFPVAEDPHNKILGLFDVTSMPSTYIIDKQGVIQKKHVGWSSQDDKTWNAVTPVIDGLLE